MSVLSDTWKIRLKESSYVGVVFVFLAAVFEAFGDVVPKYFLGDSDFGKIEPVWLVLVVFLINFLFFSLFQKRKSKEGVFFLKNSLVRKNIPLLAVIGIIDSTSTILFFYGLKFSSAINGTILGSTEILFGVFLSIILLRERIKRFEIIPIVLILAGSVMIPIIMTGSLSGEFSEDSITFGNILIVISSFVMGVGVICYKKIPEEISTKKTIQSVSFFGFLSMLFIVIVFSVPIDFSFISENDILAILFVAIVGFGLPIIFYLIGLRMIGAIKTVLIFSSTTAFGIIFSNFILSEVVQIQNIISVGLIILGGILLRKKISQ